jgi:hypothetical protein
MDFIYEIVGETMKSKPDKMFEPESVYLIVDKGLKIIWVWAGKSSRLFHRYIAANLAGKLKTDKKFYKFRYELIREGKEPKAFLIIFDEIKGNIPNLKYPGQSRINAPKKIASKMPPLKPTLNKTTPELSNSEKNRLKNLLSEIKEIQMHIKYSLEHIERRIADIEKIIET